MIYVTGDTHGYLDIHKLGGSQFSKGRQLTKDDYVIILGDFGLLWAHNRTKQEQYWLDWLSDKPWTTLVIDGNHENHTLLDDLELDSKFGSIVGCVSRDIYHLQRGEVYEIDGTSVFIMGGATSTDKAWRTEGVSWWPRELPSRDEVEYAMTNLDIWDWDVDYVLTHTAPRIIIENHFGYRDQPDYLTKFLDVVYGKCRYKHWYFGHFHKDCVVGDRITSVYQDIYKLG